MALNLNDQTANGNNLTNFGATEYTTDFPYAAIVEAIQVVGASSQYVEAPTSSSLEITGDLSIGLWIKPTTNPVSGNTYILVTRLAGSTTSDSYRFSITNTGGTLSVNIDLVNGTETFSFSYTYTPTTGAWHHYAFTYKASTGTVELFVDNVSQGAKTGAPASINTGTRALAIGAQYGAAGFDGKIADVRVYKEVHNFSDYNTLVSQKQSNLVSWWPFQPIGLSGGAAFLMNFL